MSGVALPVAIRPFLRTHRMTRRGGAGSVTKTQATSRSLPDPRAFRADYGARNVDGPKTSLYQRFSAHQPGVGARRCDVRCEPLDFLAEASRPGTQLGRPERPVESTD